MIKFILSLCFILTASKSVSQIFIENFSYTNGIFLFQTGNWNNIGPHTNPITVFSPGLTFAGYQGSGIGNMVSISAAGGNDIYSLFSSSQNDGSVYASFMLKVFFPFSDGDNIFALRSSDGGIFARVYIKNPNSSVFQLAISKAGQSSVDFTSPNYNPNETYLLIVKYKFISGGSNNDEVSLFVFDAANPPTPIEPAPTILPMTNAAPDAADLDAVVLMQGQSQSNLLLNVDGIYVNRGWFPDGVLPVELTGFNHSVNGRDVSLHWTTSGEVNNSHFEIERYSSSEWAKIGMVQGNGTSSNSIEYGFTDKNLSPGIYKYRLKQIDFNGSYNYHNLESDVKLLYSLSFRLNQNYPNPFNPVTNIEYELPVDGKVNIKVFDSRGKEVETLADEFKTRGIYSFRFNAGELPSGVYFYRIFINSAGRNFEDTKSMILLK